MQWKLEINFNFLNKIMLLDWKSFAEKIYIDLEKEISLLDKKPSLWVIFVWESETSIRYVAQKQKFAQRIWINFVLKKFKENVSEEELLKQINDFNLDKNISWFIVQLPLPKHINEKNIINSISPEKDVDWFHPINQWKLMIWDYSWFVPCTPAWIIDLLNEIWWEISWKQIVVIGRSNIVWKPITNLLINAWATLISCNSKTKDIKKFTCEADIIISATWSPWLIKLDMIKKDSIIIDVWFSLVDWKIMWDADTENINNAWIKITPVPGWVWALTVAMLMKNTLKAYKQNNF